MSGAEAILLIGIIGNTLQLVEFSYQALTRIKECRDDKAHLPKVFWSLQNVGKTSPFDDISNCEL